MLIKAAFNIIDKGANGNKINIQFKQPSELSKLNFIDAIKTYQAFCKYDLSEPADQILENCDYVKGNGKRPVRAPDLGDDLKLSKPMQKTADHNILIYDKVGEFNIRNKILESCIRVMQSEVETKPIFIAFNELYEEFVDTTEIEEAIQCYSFDQSEFIQGD